MPNTKAEDMLKIRALTERFFSSAVDIPISFALDGQAVSGIPKEWQAVSHRRIVDANIIETVFEGADAMTGLNVHVECTEYLDYPVVEWVAWFTNKGKTPTPVISDILALDGTFTGAAPVLYHGNGDTFNAEGYTPTETPLRTGDALGFAPEGGFPCLGAFPYYRIMFEGWGVTMAIGWPAQWAASFNGIADGIHVRVGQEKTHLRLMPGESIRTPRMTVLTWSGDTTRVVNLWRHWYLAHILPRPNGQPLKPLLTCWATDKGDEFTGATETNQVRYIEKFKERGIRPDVWWIDAGWYSCYNKEHERKWWLTGTWEPDAERFPNGLKPVSDRAAQDGADLLVWFEPERVSAGTKLDLEHPEWLIKTGTGESLLNLGNPECRQWLTDHVCRLIKDNGIKIYRQDCNYCGKNDKPLAYWRKNETEDRQGLKENLHVQGYLQYWDDLLTRNPGLWIDSCASGGRRNDLETMRRSVPLHYTDYGYGDHPEKLAFQRTLYEWLPYFKEFTLSWDIGGNARFDHRVDSYSFHCAMAPMLFATLDIRRDDYDFALARKMIAIWRRASALILYGDYYPHTPFHHNPEQWVARQFDFPEEGRGFIQAIRLPACPDDTLVVHPKSMQPDSVYVFENPESGESRELTGNKVNEDGFTFFLPKREGAIWFYCILKS